MGYKLVFKKKFCINAYPKGENLLRKKETFYIRIRPIDWLWLNLLTTRLRPKKLKAHHDFCKYNHSSVYRTEEEENRVVGWPPIKSWRVKQLHQHQISGQIISNADRTTDQRTSGTGSSSNSLYVKVKMKGVAIARKIDLRLYNSYQALTNSLITMFPNSKSDQDQHLEINKNQEKFNQYWF